MVLRKHDYSTGNTFHFTMAAFNKEHLFKEDSSKSILIETLENLRRKYPVKILAYCLMSNHIHVIMFSETPETFPSFIRDFKSFCHHRLRKRISSLKHTWNRRYDDNAIEDEDELRQVADYIHHNPVRAELVDEPGEYRYSSFNAMKGSDDVPLRVDQF